MNNFQNNYYPQRMYNTVNNNGITWVQGIEGAKAYQLMPNSNILLMDSENEGIFYIKISDNVGMCNLRTFKFEEILSNAKPDIDMTQYITKQELEDILNARIGGRHNDKQPVQSVKPDNSQRTN